MTEKTPATAEWKDEKPQEKPESVAKLTQDERFAYHSIKLREIKIHQWWLGTLIILIVSPFLSIPIVSNFANPFRLPRFAYLLISFILIILWFFGHFRYYRNKLEEYETSDKEGTTYPIGYAVDPYEEWSKIWKIYNKSFGKRIRKHAIGLLRLELFGWIIWTTAVVIAICEQLSSTRTLNASNTFQVAEAISSHISSNIGNAPSASAINNIILQQLSISSQNLLDQFASLMEGSSYGLARATVLGIITLFFTQMLKNIQGNVTLNYSAAASAKKAADDSNQAVNKIEGFRARLNSELRDHRNLLKGSFGIVDSEWLFLNLIKLISKVESQVKHISMTKLISPLKTQIQKITVELTESSEDADKSEFTALTVLQSTYFETEALNFEDPSDKSQLQENGTAATIPRKGVRLSTNYTHYAKAVQSLVDTFEEDISGKYEYYTILNDTQAGFFNIENDKVNLRWQVSFLEEHCRKHADKGIKFRRYFTECDNSPLDKGKLYPPKHQAESAMAQILCDKQKNPKLFVNPDELDGATKQILQNACLTPEQYEIISKISEEYEPHITKETDFKKSMFTRRESYIIKIEEQLKQSDKYATAYQQLLTSKGINDLNFENVTEVLGDKYHSKKTPPKMIRFSSTAVYDDFFSAEGNIPRDLVAVRKENEWKFCLGVMIGTDIPTAVTLVFLTEKRQLKDLSWQELTQKLDILFEINKEDEKWIKSNDIKHMPLS